MRAPLIHERLLDLVDRVFQLLAEQDLRVLDTLVVVVRPHLLGDEVQQEEVQPDPDWNLARMTASPPTMFQEFKYPVGNISRTSSMDSAYFSRNPSLVTSRATPPPCLFLFLQPSPSQFRIMSNFNHLLP